jgi:hypothetical protein
VLLDQIGDSMEGGGLGYFNITSHDWLLKKNISQVYKHRFDLAQNNWGQTPI